MKDHTDFNTNQSKSYIKSSSPLKSNQKKVPSPHANQNKKFSMLLLQQVPQAHSAYKKLSDDFKTKNDQDRSATPDFNKDVRAGLRYSMSKSSERFAFKNMAEAIDLHGSYKHYICKDKKEKKEKSCWDSLLKKTQAEVKFSNNKKREYNTEDHITDLIKDPKFKKLIPAPAINSKNKNRKNWDISHAGIKEFFDNIPVYHEKNAKYYQLYESDILNVKCDHVDYKRSKSAFNVDKLREKGYAGVPSSLLIKNKQKVMDRIENYKQDNNFKQDFKNINTKDNNVYKDYSSANVYQNNVNNANNVKQINNYNSYNNNNNNYNSNSNNKHTQSKKDLNQNKNKTFVFEDESDHSRFTVPKKKESKGYGNQPNQIKGNSLVIG